ncbi:MAG: serine hydrolase [Cyclobacteriaceae bacterium]|nr:serine hydrolase [Cyclobacteriaceae bacterium SS2]
MLKILSLLFAFSFLSISSYAQLSYSNAQPQTLEDGWTTEDLRTLGIDTLLLHKLFTKLSNEDHRIHSLLLVKNDQLLIEEYFNGYNVEKLHDLRSTTKSILALLMGIAIDKGFIQHIDDPLTQYLKVPTTKKNPDLRKSQITIRHLLTMSSGLDCDDWDPSSKGQEDKVYRKKDWIQYTLDLPMMNDPGTVSNYCSMGTVLIAEIISQATGMTIQEFAQQYLFDKLGITRVEWGHTSNKEVIASGKRLYMTPRDLAKIGQLVLNNGSWNGQQVISGSWIENATTPRTQITGIDYGYLWWNIPLKLGEKILTAKTATGNGGQYIMVIPELDLVAVFTGGAYNSQDDKLPFAIMQDIILPTFRL